MRPRQTGQRAVDEHELVADLGPVLGMREHVEQQLGVAGGRMGIGRHRAVEQLVAEDGAIGVQDGLARDGGRVGCGCVAGRWILAWWTWLNLEDCRCILGPVAGGDN